MAVLTDSDFQEEYGAARLVWNPDIAIGTSKAFQIMPGISTFVHDVTFHEDYSFSIDEENSNTLYLIYIIDGHILHRFKSDPHHIKIEKKQNVILGSADAEVNEVVWPGGVPLRLSVTDLFHKTVNQNEKYAKGFFGTGLNEIFEFVSGGNSYRHVGPVNSNCLRFAEILFQNTKIDFIGRLQIEAAILNIIATQFEAFSKFDNQYGYESGLDKSELKEILKLSEQIVTHLSKKEHIKDFVEQSGLHSKKLQTGFQHYFGESVNEFVKNARMAKAKELMEVTNLTLDEICFEIGLDSRSYFSKTFSKRYGVSPKAYRKSFKNVTPIYELSYCSNARHDLTLNDIEAIVRESETNNDSSDITGCLVHLKNSFFQIIEGNKNDVLAVYSKIKKDKRHFNVEVIWEGFKGSRTFDSWAMAYVDKNILAQSQSGSVKIDVQIEALLAKYQDTPITTRQFWERIKNRLLVEKQVT